MTDETKVTVNRTERRLAFIIAGLIAFGLLGVIAFIVFNALRIDTTSPILQSITLIPAIAFPAGIIMIVVLMIVSIVHRTRDAREAEEAAASAPPAKVTPPVRTQTKAKKKRR